MALNIKYDTPADQNRRLLSAETREDLDSCANGFYAMLKLSPGSSVVPPRMNSDALVNREGSCVVLRVRAHN